MNGVEIVATILIAAPGVTLLVPGDRIMAGALDQDMALPAILLTTISSVDRRTVGGSARVRTTDRVQVTVKAASYESKRDVLRAVRAALRDMFGDYAGMTAVTIDLDGLGPDFGPGEEGIFEQGQDALVSFNEAR